MAAYIPHSRLRIAKELRSYREPIEYIMSVGDGHVVGSAYGLGGRRAKCADASG